MTDRTRNLGSDADGGAPSASTGEGAAALTDPELTAAQAASAARLADGFVQVGEPDAIACRDIMALADSGV